MLARFPISRGIGRQLQFEPLENRIVLSSHGVGELCSPDSPVLSQSDAARATHAVNCFAYDLYEHFEREQGNLFLSPLSISTVLAMAYAGAGGETAAEMEEVLHLGREPGIHDSFRMLLQSLGTNSAYELSLANAIWPQEGFPFHEEYIAQVDADYGGRATNLDYSQPDQAKDIINNWVEEQTSGRIQI